MRAAFMQAAALIAYVALVALLLRNAERIFGNMGSYLGPLLFISLFSTSALIAGLLTLGYPVLLIWDKKRPTDGVRVVAYTAGWLALFVLIFLGSRLASR